MDGWLSSVPMEAAFSAVIVAIALIAGFLGWLVGRLGNDWKVHRIAAGLRDERARRVEVEAQLIRLMDPADIPPADRGEHLPTGVDVWLRDYLRE